MASSPPTKRDQRRDARRQQFQQRQDERRRARERALRMKRIRTYGAIGGGIVGVLLIVGLVTFFATRPQPLGAANGSPVDTIQCGTSEQLQVHYHANLQIYANGQLQQVPAGAGIVEPNLPGVGPHLATNGATVCLYWLHTHDTSGVIHIESPTNRSYTLGNFFDIWGQHLSATRVGKYTVGKGQTLTVEIFDAGGHLSVYTGDPRNIVLKSRETIVLLYDSPHVQPTPFNFTQAGLSQ
jgi:hypothetical protein